MEARWIALVLSGILVCFCTGGVTSRKMAANTRCISMHDGPPSSFASCSVVGYNNTFSFPKKITEAEISRISGFFRWALSRMENCSQNAVADAMACSMFVPKCVTSSPDPVLPCRRVCSEFLKQCGVKLPRFLYDWFIGMCEILPNKTASSGECLEPKGFKVNKSIPDPLDRECQPIIMPYCQGKGYTNTLLHVETQKKFYRRVHGRNYTKDAPKEFPPLIKRQLERYGPKCRVNVEKLLCAALFPPCFPHEGPAYYTLCQSGCQEIYDDCPDVEGDGFVDFVCTTVAEGNSSHGYCKETKWPNPTKWIFRRRRRPTSTEGPATKGGPSAGVIAAAVIVPVILVGAFIGAAFYWKKRQVWPGVKYRKQEDDMAPVVTET